MRKDKKRLLRGAVALLLCAALAVPLALAAEPGEAAAATGESGPSLRASIDIGEDDNTIFSASSYHPNDEVPGVSYSYKTNTLTLKNVNLPDSSLYIDEMGENFKIKVSGKNTLGQIWSSCGIRLTGNGSLTVNPKKNFRQGGILLRYGSSRIASRYAFALKIEKSVRLKVYGKDGRRSIDVAQTSVSKGGIKRDGGGIKVKKSVLSSKMSVTEQLVTKDAVKSFYPCTPNKGSSKGKYVADIYEASEDKIPCIYELIPFTGVKGVKYAAVLGRNANGKRLNPNDFTISSQEEDKIKALDMTEQTSMTVYKKGSKEYYVRGMSFYEAKAVKDDGKKVVGYVAVPVKGMQNLKKIPSGYSKQSISLYHYSVTGNVSVKP